jgi:hypothetical protein
MDDISRLSKGRKGNSTIIGIAHITLKSGEVLSCLVRNETPNAMDIQVLRVLSNSLFNYSSGLIKTVNKRKIKQIEWKY